MCNSAPPRSIGPEVSAISCCSISAADSEAGFGTSSSHYRNAHLTYPPTRTIMTMLRLSLGGGQSLRQGSSLLHRLQSSHYAPSSSTAAHHFAVRRSFADDAKKDPPKGTPYSKLTVGVPKETFPLEKRVAATPDVSLLMLLAFVSQLSLGNTRTCCCHVYVFAFFACCRCRQLPCRRHLLCS